jgi:polysaccharide export outer membrane protein
MILSTNLLFASPIIPAPAPEQAVSSYQLSKYDVLNIVILGMSSTDSNLGFSDVMIGPDGFVNLPYAGSIKLSGLTIPEATQLLADKLGQYIKIPGMAIMIKTYGPRKVYVMGEVNKPGIYDLSWDRMNIISAISSANGIGLRGHPKHVQVVRMVNNQIESKEINFKKLLQKGDLTQNIPLHDGDLVYVPHSGRIDFNTDILPFANLYLLYKAATN